MDTSVNILSIGKEQPHLIDQVDFLGNTPLMLGVKLLGSSA